MDSEIIDVKMEFLYGALKEETFMKISEGLQDCINLPEGPVTILICLSIPFPKP
jgi:hypothetical protein